MESGHKILATAAICASVLMLVAFIVWIRIRETNRRRTPEKYGKTGVSSVLVFSLFLMLSIWCLRFAVGYYDIIVSRCPAQKLTPIEEIGNSFFKALRTFSLEEEYKEYILDIKGLTAELISAENWHFPYVQAALIVYASALNLLAPIMGGAIILEILASAFPKLRLRWVYMFSRRPKYYFSELNPATLALAKSLFYDEEKGKPILIFTDTYVDDEKEKDAELLLEAKKFGAICVRDDLIHVAKTARGERKYFLMDQNEFGNLQTLMGLVEDHNVKFIRNCEIYLFVQSDAYVQVEKQINRKLDGEKKKKLLGNGEKPTIIPINAYRNLVNNLFVDVPLFEPLIRKKDQRKLSLTILGNGMIGTEAFLSAYWFGQMLVSGEENGASFVDECEMTINIVSKDTEDVFWSKIDYINSEIRDTVRVLSDDEDSKEYDLLAYSQSGECNKPYCSVRYVKADVKVDGFWDGNIPQAQDLLESDYFIVALGDDADNISIADKLRRLIGKKHLEKAAMEQVPEGRENEQRIVSDDVVIAYAVFDSDIAAVLNERKAYQCSRNGITDVYMYAFGSIEQVYSVENVTMSKSEILAKGTGKAYTHAQRMQSHIADNKKRKKDENRNYSYWADQARAMHIRYKAFSLGLIQKSVFDLYVGKPESHEAYIVQQCALYKQITKADKKVAEEILAAAESKRHLLAWLEHRRWTAFTRTMGYQFTGEFRKNLYLNGENHKNMELKLHPCLVEAAKPELDGKSSYLQDCVADIFTPLEIEANAEMLNGYPLTAVSVLPELNWGRTVSFALRAKECDLYAHLLAALGGNSRGVKRLEKLLCSKETPFVTAKVALDGGDTWPVAIKVERKAGKKRISVAFNVDNLSAEQMAALLHISRDYFETQMSAVSGVEKEGLDRLDLLTVNWCEEATRFSIQRIDAMLQALQNQEGLEAVRKDFATVWSGIGCYDFKTYDYFAHDFC